MPIIVTALGLERRAHRIELIVIECRGLAFEMSRFVTRRALNRHWAFSKKKPDCPTLVDGKQSNKTTKVFAQRARGRANVFSFYVIIITLTLRFRLRYVNVADVTFSFTLRSRSGRVARVKRIAARV